jgi:hypothetical protein
VSNRAQEFKTVTLFLQGEAVIGFTIDNDLPGLNLPALSFSRRRHHLAMHTDAGTGAKLSRHRECRRILADYDLQAFQTGPIVEGEKNHPLASPYGTQPTLDEHVALSLLFLQYIFYPPTILTPILSGHLPPCRIMVIFGLQPKIVRHQDAKTPRKKP